MRHALCILTYAPVNAADTVLSRLPYAIESLQATSYEGPVCIVDDGSSHPGHVALLDSLAANFRIVRRRENGGICRAKNTCLRVLMEFGVDVGFIAEDDIEFREDWHKRYLAIHQKVPAVNHLSWAWDDDPSGKMRKSAVRMNGVEFVRTSRLNGLLLTVTRRVIDTVGGFRILPGKWGHTHTNWTRRIVHAGLTPFYADIANSNNYIRCGPAATGSALSTSQKRESERRNRVPARDMSRLHFPLEE